MLRGPRLRALLATPAQRHLFFDRSAHLTKTMGDELTEDALRGFIRAYDRLIKHTPNGIPTDRYADLLKLFKADTTTSGKTALKESLENFKAVTDATPTNPQPLMHFKKIETVQDTMYRYHNFDPRFAPDGSLIPGTPKLGARSDNGWYVSFDRFNDAATAKSKAQLPPISTAKYRIEFETIAIKDKAYLPYGFEMQSTIKEPVTRDFIENGIGGATQVLVKDQEIPVKAIYEMIDGSYTKIWPST